MVYSIDMIGMKMRNKECVYYSTFRKLVINNFNYPFLKVF